MKRSVVVVVVAAALVAASAFAAAPAAQLASRVEAAQTAFAPEQPVALSLHLANRGAASVWVLRWQLPSESIEGDILEVTRNGEPVEYLGRLIKRLPPTASDYVEIAAGAELAAAFDPTAVYDMRPAGHYAITFKAWQLDVLDRNPALEPAPGLVGGKPGQPRVQPRLERGGIVPEVVESQTAEFWFDGIDVELAVEAQGIGGYTGNCSSVEINQLQAAHANAITYSGKAKAHLAANPNGSTLYTYWFGAYASTRFNTVKTHYNAINDAFANKSVTYDCSCNQDYFAYVYPTQPYKIYVCNVFWEVGATGRDSQMGTLIHEMSHFRVVASTDDYVYGATGAHNLAVKTPKKAIDNADNHEYFAEDQK